MKERQRPGRRHAKLTPNDNENWRPLSSAETCSASMPLRRWRSSLLTGWLEGKAPLAIAVKIRWNE
jgi:hypothetical protein